MKRPSFQFYPADWRTDTNLRRCSAAARGVWMDVLCLLHDADEYGVLRWPLKEIAVAAGAQLNLVRELAAKSVLKGGDKDVPPYIHTPRHAGKEGEPVELLAASEGPCWYSARFLKDEWRRSRRGEGTRFDSDNQPNKPLKRKPTRRVGVKKGGVSGDGPSSSSSPSGHSEPNGSGADAPKSDPLFGAGLAFLLRKGIPEKPARSLIGQLRKTGGDVIAGKALADCEELDITDPAPWLMQVVGTRADQQNGGSNAPRRNLSASEQVRAAVAGRGHADAGTAEAGIAGRDRRPVDCDG